MFAGFESRRARVPMAGGQGDIHCVIGGKGPPVLLLHGHPQTLFMWHKVAPALAERFTVVCADLRGYGDSDKPKGDERHETYSKRAMAADMVTLMRGLGFERFALVGHDRGGRVGHRLCLDHPDAVRLFVPIDISPTLTIYESTNRELATRYFHWFFLIQPYPFPEKLIEHDIDFYMPWMLGQRWRAPIVHAPEAIAEYIRCAKLPGTIHAMCEDYRAADSIDLEHDRADRAPDGRRTRCPLHALWAQNGMIAKMFNPIVDFAPWAAGPITGKVLPGGHYLPEESSGHVIDELLRIL